MLESSWLDAFRNIDLWWWIIAGGFAALMLMVLVVARLRVIHTRPIRACIVLSVFAHILFLSSAHLLRLFDSPQFPGDDTIQFQLTFDDVTVEEQQEKPSEKRVEIADLEPPARDVSAEVVKSLELQPPADPVQTEIDASAIAEEFLVAARPPALEDLEIVAEEKPVADANEEQSDQEPLQPKLELTPPAAEETPTTTIAPEVASNEPPAAPDSPETAPDEMPDAAATEERLVQEEPSVLPPTDQGHWRPPATPPQPLATSNDSKYDWRDLDTRSEMAKQRGGTARSEEAVDAALLWLVRNQERDGRWSAQRHHAGRGGFVEGQLRQTTGIRADTGVTGLALLALLGGGHTHERGPYKQHVQAGLEYLRKQQQANGNLAGPAGSFAQMYCHGIATLAVCEAYGMTKDARLEPVARRAVEYTVRSQHQTTGGWRYYPGDPGDTSQFGWQLMVVESAREAGIFVPEKTRWLTRRFLSLVTSGTHRGLAAYRPGKAPTPAMTAEALACRAFQGSVDRQLRDEAAQFIIRHAPNNQYRNFYFWYYGTLALYQTDSEHWSTWNAALHRALIPTQRRDGRLAGSWDTDTVWGGCGGRVYTTAIAALCLEVYYRYVPVRCHQLARLPR